MKLGKLLNDIIDDMFPELSDKFLSYKVLKKQLKRVYSRDGGGNKRIRLTAGDEIDPVTVEKEIAEFVKLCHEQIDKFNDFVLEKQEWYIIKIEVLEGNLVAAKDLKEELMKLGRDLVDLHGEIVLLLNYSALNYTGLVKILKKHDRLSGALIRLPFLEKVLNEPFYKTDVLNDLVKKCETMLEQIFTMNEHQSSLMAKKESSSLEHFTEPESKCSTRVPANIGDIKNIENMYMKRTFSALRVLKGIRSGSSTVNVFSLPPMQ